MLKINLLQ